MIVIGSVDLSGHIIAPLGFGTARGIRLSNISPVPMIISNITGVEQSQEYLHSGAQMVYSSTNVSMVPTVSSSLSPSVTAALLHVEWSTDPVNDFVGTYPATVNPGSVQAYSSPVSVGTVSTLLVPSVTGKVITPLTIIAFKINSSNLMLQDGNAGPILITIGLPSPFQTNNYSTNITGVYTSSGNGLYGKVDTGSTTIEIGYTLD